uniref:alcohol dehydrogenase (NADP(+)) n=1 Tax=Magnetococcus massalia (strain MO-1) TaxID=451514 RepID=A0A1S7LP94_MAGMO|nr:Alcohol dehydrogenase, Zn-dependent and NAD(P)-binding [Candidatus Magnetococcus massalia]
MIQAYAAKEQGGLLEPFSYDPGPLGSHEVEIDVHYCGICHSDLSMLENAWGISSYPLVPGHEVAGVVAAVGEHVAHLSVGQKVGLGWHAGYCEHCSPCLSGDHNLCSSAEATIVAHHGGFADRVRAQATSVVPLPEGVDMATAGPLFCGGVTVFNPLVQFDIKPTHRVGVVGIGGLGHMALQFLNAWGCGVTAFTSSIAKADEALKMGAHTTLDSRDPEALAAAAGQFDLILSTVNVKLDWNAYIQTLKPKGRLHLLGATLEPLDLQLFPMLMGQRSVSASPVGSPAVIAQMLDFCARHGIQPVTEEFPMEQVNEAMAHLKAGQARYRVVLKRDAR